MSVSNPFRGSAKHGERGSEDERAETLPKMDVSHFQMLMAGDRGQEQAPQQAAEATAAAAQAHAEGSKASPPTPPAARRSRKSMESVPLARAEEEPGSQDSHPRHKPSPPPPRRTQPRSSSRPERSEKEDVDVGRQRSYSFGRRAAPPPPPPPHQYSLPPERLPSGEEESEKDLLANLSQLQREIDALRGMEGEKERREALYTLPL